MQHWAHLVHLVSEQHEPFLCSNPDNIFHVLLLHTLPRRVARVDHRQCTNPNVVGLRVRKRALHLRASERPSVSLVQVVRHQVSIVQCGKC